MKSRNMNCTVVETELSAHLDGALHWEQSAQVETHLKECGNCRDRADQLGALRRMVRATRVAPPPDLEIQVRLRVARKTQPAMGWALELLSRAQVHLTNFLKPVMIPAVSGLVTAMLIFGGFIYQFALPLDVTNDVPLIVQTPARLHFVPPINFITSPDGVTMQIEVDYQGRITNFQVLEGGMDPQQMRELRNVLVMTQFEPATRFGVPTASRTVIKFSGISVKG
jgi:hypothetical protein